MNLRLIFLPPAPECGNQRSKLLLNIRNELLVYIVPKIPLTVYVALYCYSGAAQWS